MIWLLALPCGAWDDGDDDVGFGDFEAPEAQTPDRSSPFSAGGTVRSNEALWVERLGDRPWARARQSLDLWGRYRRGALRIELSGHGELDLVYWVDRDAWDDATFDTYAWQALPREALVAVSAGELEVTAGRQLVVWGEGQLISPLDVVAARDLREPGLAELDDMRLPVTALRIGWFRGVHRVELMAVPEFDPGILPSASGPYSPLPALLGGAGPLGATVRGATFVWDHIQPRWAVDQLQGFTRWRFSERVDLGLYAATLLDKQGTLGLPAIGVPEAIGLPLPLPDAIRIPIQHRRYTMVGASVAAPAGDFLVRAELLGDLDRAYETGEPADLTLTVTSTDMVRGMVGSQYAGIPRTTFDVELAGGVFVDRPDDLLFPVDAPTGGVQVVHTALRERLRVAATGLGFGWDLRYGGLLRADLTYAIADGWHAGVGGIVYRPGSERGPLLGLDTHDQVFVQGRFSF